MRKNIFLLLIVLGIMCFLLGDERPSRSNDRISTPPTPFSISGLVKFNGFFIGVDDPVLAQCGTFSFGPAWVQILDGQSYYSMDIPGDDPDTAEIKDGCYSSEPVTFTIKGEASEQTSNWKSTITPEQLDLSFGTPNLVFLPMVRR